MYTPRAIKGHLPPILRSNFFITTLYNTVGVRLVCPPANDSRYEYAVRTQKDATTLKQADPSYVYTPYTPPPSRPVPFRPYAYAPCSLYSSCPTDNNSSAPVGQIFTKKLTTIAAVATLYMHGVPRKQANVAPPTPIGASHLLDDGLRP